MRKWLVIAPIRFYQKGISPFFPAKCRFYPTCSRYAIEAIERFGAFRGMLMGLCRILRCNPFFKGGYDPVPKKFSLRPFAANYEAPDCESED